MLIIKRKITLSLMFLFSYFHLSQAQFYLGGGASFTRSTYRTAENRSAGNTPLSREYNILSKAMSSKFSYSGSQADLADTIYDTLPQKTSDISFFIRFSQNNFGSVCEMNDSIADPSYYAIESGKCVSLDASSKPPSIFNLQTDNEAKAIALIETEFGRAVGNFFIENIEGLNINFAPNNDKRTEFRHMLGKKLMAAFMGSPNYTRTQILDKLTNSSLLDSSQLTLALGKLTNDEMADQFNIFQEAFIEAVNSMNINFANEEGLIEDDLTNIPTSASGYNAQISLLAGLGTITDKIYLGAEILLDLGPQKIGKNSSSQIQVSSLYTAGIIGKLGYSFQKRSFNYINLGLAVREYTDKYKGSSLSFSNSSFSSHALMGVGMEFLLNKSIGLFTEINYMVSMSAIDSGSSNGKTLSIASTQLKIGAKYYFGEHPLISNLGYNAPDKKNKFRASQATPSYSNNINQTSSSNIKRPTDLNFGRVSSSIPNVKGTAKPYYAPGKKKGYAAPYSSSALSPASNIPYDVEYETKIIIRSHK